LQGTFDWLFLDTGTHRLTAAYQNLNAESVTITVNKSPLTLVDRTINTEYGDDNCRGWNTDKKSYYPDDNSLFKIKKSGLSGEQNRDDREGRKTGAKARESGDRSDAGRDLWAEEDSENLSRIELNDRTAEGTNIQTGGSDDRSSGTRRGDHL